MRWIVRPSDPECRQEAIAGGKGSSLARLCELGAAVPPFLVVPTAAHREMAGSGLTKELIDELQSLAPRPDQIMSADEQHALDKLRMRQDATRERNRSSSRQRGRTVTERSRKNRRPDSCSSSSRAA